MTLPIRAYENDETFCFDANPKPQNQQKKIKISIDAIVGLLTINLLRRINKISF